MKITRAICTPVYVPMEAPLRWSMGVETGTARTIVELHTDEGVVGLGETYGGAGTAARFKSAIVARYGRIDVWINNAGIYPRVAAEDVTLELWRKIVATNLEGTWNACEALIPQLRRQRSGVIINVGSIALRLGMPEVAPYLASKGGIVGLTRGLARDLGRYGVRVNCLHLGAVLVPSERRAFPDAEATRRVEEKQCLPGRLTPESVEPWFAFLASAESGDVTGQCLTVDRGWTHD
jgi:3-oxoacyl-[acyl-carrier protein] reductase